MTHLNWCEDCFVPDSSTYFGWRLLNRWRVFDLINNIDKWDATKDHFKPADILAGLLLVLLPSSFLLRRCKSQQKINKESNVSQKYQMRMSWTKNPSTWRRIEEGHHEIRLESEEIRLRANYELGSGQCGLERSRIDAPRMSLNVWLLHRVIIGVCEAVKLHPRLSSGRHGSTYRQMWGNVPVTNISVPIDSFQPNQGSIPAP